MNNYITDFEYRQLNSKQLIIPTKYQRELDEKRVKRIVAEFDASLVNPIKVSKRNGAYYVFDGQHTLAALKLKNGGRDLVVDCKIYSGLTEADEALLFSKQNGISRSVHSLAKFKALAFAGDIEVTEMIKLTEKAGFRISFTAGFGNNKIVAVSKLYKIFKSTSASEFIEILIMIKGAWNGIPESLSENILGGAALFYKTYKGEFNKNVFEKQLSKCSPTIIIREARAYSGGGDLRFAREILKAYNKGLSTKRLQDKL